MDVRRRTCESEKFHAHKFPFTLADSKSVRKIIFKGRTKKCFLFTSVDWLFFVNNFASIFNTRVYKSSVDTALK